MGVDPAEYARRLGYMIEVQLRADPGGAKRHERPLLQWLQRAASKVLAGVRACVRACVPPWWRRVWSCLDRCPFGARERGGLIATRTLHVYVLRYFRWNERRSGGEKRTLWSS